MTNKRSITSVPWQDHMKPVVDELQLNEFSMKIHQSYISQQVLEFTLFGGIENYTIHGVVVHLDKTSNRFRIMVNGELEWICMSEIASIEAK